MQNLSNCAGDERDSGWADRTSAGALDGLEGFPRYYYRKLFACSILQGSPKIGWPQSLALSVRHTSQRELVT